MPESRGTRVGTTEVRPNYVVGQKDKDRRDDVGVSRDHHTSLHLGAYQISN